MHFHPEQQASEICCGLWNILFIYKFNILIFVKQKAVNKYMRKETIIPGITWII